MVSKGRKKKLHIHNKNLKKNICLDAAKHTKVFFFLLLWSTFPKVSHHVLEKLQCLHPGVVWDWYDLPYMPSCQLVKYKVCKVKLLVVRSVLWNKPWINMGIWGQTGTTFILWLCIQLNQVKVLVSDEVVNRSSLMMVIRQQRAVCHFSVWKVQRVWDPTDSNCTKTKGTCWIWL